LKIFFVVKKKVLLFGTIAPKFDSRKVTPAGAKKDEGLTHFSLLLLLGLLVVCQRKKAFVHAGGCPYLERAFFSILFSLGIFFINRSASLKKITT